MAAPMDAKCSTPKYHFSHSHEPEKRRKIFSNYGNGALFTGDCYGALIKQRIGVNNEGLRAVNPPLPIVFEANEATAGHTDVVLRDIKEVNGKLKSYVTDIYYHRRKYNTVRYKEDKEAVPELKRLVKQYDETGTVDLAKVNNVLTPWLRKQVQDYRELKKYSGRQLHNPKFTNGCLAFVPHDKKSGFMVTPADTKFMKLRLSHIEGDVDNILHPKYVLNLDLPHTIYGISNVNINSGDYICARMDKTCLVFKLLTDENDRPRLENMFHVNTAKPDQCFQSVSLSPYIVGECCVTNDAEEVSLWNCDQQVMVFHGTDSSQAKLSSCSVHFGSHPRCLICTNAAVVRLFDLRRPGPSPVCLFSGEHLCSDGREQFRVCQPSPRSPFYHYLATDYHLILLDERFPNKPVLKFEHMLQTMPQYISGISKANDDVVYIGSQYRPVVHTVTMREVDGNPPQLVGYPQRIGSQMDLGSIPDVVESSKAPLLLRERLEVSLAGVKAVPYENGHLVLQLNGLGEIFYQILQENSESDRGIEDASDKTVMKPSAARQLKAWVHRVESDEGFQKKLGPTFNMDCTKYFSEMVSGLPGFIGCPLCMPVVSEVISTEQLGHIQCPSCNGVLSESRTLKEVIEQDRIYPEPEFKLPEHLQLPTLDGPSDSWNELSHQLWKHYRTDTAREDLQRKEDHDIENG